MTTLSAILSALTPWLLGAVMACAFVILMLRGVAEPFSPGIRFGALVRRLSNRQALGVNGHSPEESSPLSRQLRRRLSRNQWALHTQVRLLWWILCVMLLSRLVILASAMVGSVLTGSLDNLFTAAISHWVRSDAADYIDLARYGYDMAARPALIAFLPMYPLCVRLVSVLCFGHYVFAGFLVSNICLAVASWALYHIVYQTQGERTARRAVLIMLFSPLSLVFSVPYAESMFLMFTLLSVLCARNRNFPLAALFGALSAATRLMGIITIVPLFMEAAKYLHMLDLRRKRRGRFARYAALHLLLCACVLLGTAWYLLLNNRVAGSPFAFVTVLANQFYQQPGSLFATMGYSVRNAFEFGDVGWQIGTWIPQAVFTLAAAVLLLVSAPTVDPADGLYAWCYLMLAMCPTWMLSGPRTLTAMYPAYIMLAAISRKKGSYIAIMIISIALMCFFSYTYALQGTVI